MINLTFHGAAASTETVEAAICRVGLAPVAVPLSHYLVYNLLRSAWLACLAAVFLWFGRRKHAAMRDATWNPTRDAVTDAADGHATMGQVARICGTARVIARRGSNFCFDTTVETDAAKNGLLLVDERYTPDLSARVDGQAIAVYRANALWCAVPVPAGHHRVVIGLPWHPGLPATSALTGLLMAGWGLARIFRHPRTTSPSGGVK